MMKHGFVVAAVLLGTACGDNSPATEGDPDAMTAQPDADVADTTAPTTTASPAGGVGFDLPETVTLTADEPSTIYYTTDGTTPTTASASGPSPLAVTGITAVQPLQFFAVDAADNAEAVKSEAYSVDRAFTITIADPTGTPVVTVTKQPVGMTLSVANAVIVPPVAGGSVTVGFDLTAVSGVERRVFNLKAIVAATTQGAVVPDGTLPGGKPFAHFGPRALVEGSEVTRQMQFSGLTGVVDPVTVDLELGDAPMLYGGGGYNDGITAVDTSWAGNESQLDPTGLTYGGANGTIDSAVMTADESTIYLANRSMPSLIALDTETFEATLSPSLSVLANSPNGVGCTGGVALSPDEQYLYTVLIDGNHMYDGSDADGDGSDAVTIELVRIERATLAEVDRVTLMSSMEVDNNYIRARTFAISPDGSTAAIPLKGASAVALVDLATMTLIDTDAVAAGTQLLDVSVQAAGDDVRGVAFSADGSTVYLPTYLTSADVIEVDVATFAVTTRALDNPLLGGRTTDAQLGPDGRLYIVRRNVDAAASGVVAIDLAGGTQTEYLANRTAYGLTFTPDGTHAVVHSNSGFELIDLATGELADLDLDAGNGQTGYASFNVQSAHHILMTAR